MDSISRFQYRCAPYRYVARYRDGKWEKGSLSTEATITLNESACVFQYAQNVFEGLKARKSPDGKILCFRPDKNAARMADSCRRMYMPVFPEEMFIDAVREVVLANQDLVPEYGDGSSLYIRPFMIGTDPVLGVRPATEYEFRIFVSPVGPYFSKEVSLRVCDYDRAAPHGTGKIKAGLNYAMSLFPIAEAHALGYDENLYVDAATRTYVEETGGANIFFIKEDGSLVTPRRSSHPSPGNPSFMLPNTIWGSLQVRSAFRSARSEGMKSAACAGPQPLSPRWERSTTMGSFTPISAAPLMPPPSPRKPVRPFRGSWKAR